MIVTGDTDMHTSHTARQRPWGALLISVYFILLSTLYSAQTPLFEGPDEASHVIYSEIIAETGALPPILRRDAPTMLARITLQAHHPPLYYLLGVPAMWLTTRTHIDAYLQTNPFARVGAPGINNYNAYLHPVTPPDDTRLAVAFMRAVSIALSTITLWLVYRTAYLVTTDRRLALTAMLVVASLPSFIFISAIASNDNLTTLLYSAGVLWLVRIWQARTISSGDALLLGAIIAGIALTKFNGLTLIALVYGWLSLGGVLGRFRWQAVARAMLVSATLLVLLAGWWYVRNWQVYGDPLALSATLRVWARGRPPSEWTAIASEIEGVWRSFWMVLGVFNIQGAEWVFVSAGVLVILGSAGMVVYIYRHPKSRWLSLLLLSVIGLALVALVLATRQVNVSQGRILFPMLTAFATVLVLGWRALIPRWYPVLALPLVVAALTGVLSLADAYRLPRPVAELPPSATATDVYAESLALVGFELHTPYLDTDEIVELTVYVRGTHPANPALVVKLIDPVTGVPVGGIDTFPAMSATASWQRDVIYALSVRFTYDRARLTGYQPRQLSLLFDWRMVDRDDLENIQRIPWQTADGQTLNDVIVPGPTIYDVHYTPPALDQTTATQFADVVGLRGYSIDHDQLQAGGAVTVTTNWQAQRATTVPYRLSVGLLSVDGQLVAQADGDVPYLPSVVWQADMAFTDTRTLTLPDDLPAEYYRLYATWYNPQTGERLPVTGDGADASQVAFIHRFD